MQYLEEIKELNIDKFEVVQSPIFKFNKDLKIVENKEENQTIIVQTFKNLIVDNIKKYIFYINENESIYHFEDKVIRCKVVD